MTDRQREGQTDGHGDSYIIPQTVCGRYIKKNNITYTLFYGIPQQIDRRVTVYDKLSII